MFSTDARGAIAGKTRTTIPIILRGAGKEGGDCEKEAVEDSGPELAAPPSEAVLHLFPPTASVVTAASALTQGRVTAARSGAGREGRSWRGP